MYAYLHVALERLELHRQNQWQIVISLREIFVEIVNRSWEFKSIGPEIVKVFDSNCDVTDLKHHEHLLRG